MNSRRTIMGKISSFTLFMVVLTLLIGTVATITVIELNDRHEEKLVYSMETKIAYYAKRCYLENNCKDTITLKDLYDRKYIKEVVVHPVSKEILDETTTIEYKNKEIVINWK